MPDPLEEVLAMFAQVRTRQFWGDVLTICGLFLLAASAGPLTRADAEARASARVGTLFALAGLGLAGETRKSPAFRPARGMPQTVTEEASSAAPTIAADRSNIMVNLASKRCVPCSGGVPALRGVELDRLAAQVPAWEVRDEHHLYRDFSFPDFAQALAFVNRVGAVAEQEGHHPDIALRWGKVGIELWTHKVDGLTESDFILAAKIDQLA
jgi:4a-hydroxytetrahydrobiopterin dehydratase